MTRSRAFCSTDYVLDLSFWKNICNKQRPIITYCIVGEETCPTTGKKHFQCYVYYKNPRECSTVIREFSPRHVEIARGSPEQNQTYCSKETVIFEHGELPSQGERHDLDLIRDEIAAGARVDDILVDRPMAFHQFGRTMDRLEDRLMMNRYRTEMTKGIWLYGKTGCGKSKKAFEGFTPDTHYVHNLEDRGWWDNYSQQDTVIIDEFRGQIPYSTLLRLVDINPFTVSRRNRKAIPFVSKTVIITSSLHPREVYCNLSQNDSLEQLYRRFEIIEIKKNTEVVIGNTNAMTCSAEAREGSNDINDLL